MLTLAITKPAADMVYTDNFLSLFFPVKESSLMGLTAEYGRPGLKPCFALLLRISKAKYVKSLFIMC